MFSEYGEYAGEFGSCYRTMKLTLDMMEKREKIIKEKKSATGKQRQESAQVAFIKYNEKDKESLSLKEWKSISMWVFPQAEIPAPSTYSTKSLIEEKFNGLEWKTILQ